MADENEQHEEQELPDIRVVTIAVDASDGVITDVEVDAAGTGYYEAVGMVVCALFKMLEVCDEDADDEE